LDACAEAFAAVCDRAARAGMLAHLEFFPWSGMADMRVAWEIARRADRPNGGVLVDLWHLARGPNAGVLVDEVPGEKIFCVQVNDVLAQPRAEVAEEGMHHRQLPGAGAGQVAALLGELRARGCRAPFEVEVFNDDLHALDPFEAARRAAAALRSVAPQA
jgi:sugar phosphate isomerase/epimerase